MPIREMAPTGKLLAKESIDKMKEMEFKDYAAVLYCVSSVGTKIGETVQEITQIERMS